MSYFGIYKNYISVQQWLGDLCRPRTSRAPDTWHLTPDTWHLIPDTWHLVPGTWHLVPDTWQYLALAWYVCWQLVWLTGSGGWRRERRAGWGGGKRRRGGGPGGRWRTSWRRSLTWRWATEEECEARCPGVWLPPASVAAPAGGPAGDQGHLQEVAGVPSVPPPYTFPQGPALSPDRPQDQTGKN